MTDTEIQEIVDAIFASRQKVVAGLKHAASGQYQDYPEGVLELGVALDGLDMLVADIFNALPNQHLGHLALECLNISRIADVSLSLTAGPCRDIM